MWLRFMFVLCIFYSDPIVSYMIDIILMFVVGLSFVVRIFLDCLV